ncbi:MAG: ABC transporter permease, partial [Acidobacteria bacterium]|nr:ABC transporter permease [Acidobacteriota bacterium]
TRYRIIGVILVALGIVGYLLFANGVSPDLVSEFGLNASQTTKLPDWIIPSYATATALSAICLFLGGYQLARGFGRWTNQVLGLAVLLFVFSFLTWATRDASINLAGMLKGSLLRAVPLTLGALSGVLSERAGVVNIAIEGMMLAGAMVGSLVGSLALQRWPAEQFGSLSLWVGLMAALLTGAALALIHALLSIRYKVDQIISGVTINIFSVGITSFISAKFLQEFQELNNPGIFQTVPIPGLSQIPVIGPILFESNLFTYLTYILLVVVHLALFYTAWGLRTRAVGEHPKAADTLGINVFRTRYLAVLLSGLMAGLAGGYFTLGSVGRFDEVMTAGRGFIALAAVIFGNWTPFGAFGASLIFGFADSLQGRLAILRVPIPSQFLLMAPYVATMI